MAYQQNNAIQISADSVPVPAGFNEDLDLIIKTYAKDLDQNELRLFVADAHSRGLSITKRQIYATKYSGKMTIMVGIDGYRAMAEAHPDYAGQDGPYWCGEDGIWKDVWLSEDFPRAAKVGVYRRGFAAPLFAIAHWNEYVQTFYDKSSGQQKVGNMWQKFPALMVGKCAEALALRKAFPDRLGGTYTAEEMSQARNTYESAVTVVDMETGTVIDAPQRQPQAPERGPRKDDFPYDAQNASGGPRAPRASTRSAPPARPNSAAQGTNTDGKAIHFRGKISALTEPLGFTAGDLDAAAEAIHNAPYQELDGGKVEVLYNDLAGLHREGDLADYLKQLRAPADAIEIVDVEVVDA